MPIAFIKYFYKRFVPASPHAGSLKNSVKEGITAEISIRAMDYYLIPFALLMGASPTQIGALIAFPNLFSSLTLVLSPVFIRILGSRLRVIRLCMALQALFLLPIGLLYFLGMPLSLIALVIAVSIFRILGTVIGPAWGSLMSEYLRQEERGKYFGGRSQILGITGVLATAVWAGMLQTMSGFSEIAGYVFLFLTAGLFRFLSYTFASRMEDLPVVETFSLRKLRFTQLFRSLHERNFVKFISYVAASTFATQMALPYFSVWMLEGMKLNYLWYSAIHLTSVISGLIAFPLWGRTSDVTGNARILKRASFLIALIPFLWILARNPVALMCVEVFSGFVWSGFNLCVTNYVYDSCRKEDRVKCLVNFNMINGLAAFAGVYTGGILVEHMPPLTGYPILSVFFASGLLRLAAHLFISGRFEEVRQSVERASRRDVFLSVVGIRPLSGRQGDWDRTNTA